jgi:hypothetical protein
MAGHIANTRTLVAILNLHLGKPLMNKETLILNFRTAQNFSGDEILAICTDRTLRADLIIHFRVHRDRTFALSLLDTFIELRKDSENEISNDDLMLASFILGMHGQVEDSLKVWEAKRVDFDTYCGVDIQLVPFAGVNKTVSFLRTQNDDEAKEALEYIVACSKAGDFDDLEKYYNNETPWWL